MTVSLDELQSAVWIYDTDYFCIRWANSSALELWESTSLDELYSRDFQPETSAAVRESLEILKQELMDGALIDRVWQITPKGISKDILCRFKAYDLDGRTTMLVEAIPLKVLQSHIHAGTTTILATFQRDGLFTSGNPPFIEQIGTDVQRLDDILPMNDDRRRILQAISGSDLLEEDMLINTYQGRIWHHITAKKVHDQSGQHTILIQLSNIHSRKMKELSLEEESQTDSLTGLLNRKGITQELGRIHKNNTPFALYFIDLDGFKMINDTFGHAIGDELLVAVAQRLTQHRIGIAGRIGGDEFLWLSYDSGTADEEKGFAQALVEKLSNSYFTRAGHRLSISASIGIVRYPEDGVAIEQLISSADTAMYYAKQGGRRRFIHYKPGMEDSIRRRSDLIQQLHRAIENNELRVLYQSIVDTQSAQIIAFESLLRWESKTLGSITTEETIKVAESIGLIDEIEKWVITRAIEDLPALREATKSEARLSVNISGLHLSDVELPEFLLRQLKKAQLSSADLNVELTESIFIDNIDKKDDTIQKLIDSGISISIDDFGTGYSSLAYLHDIPATTVKIDRSFIDRIPSSETTLDFIRALITNLGMKAIAEGIETAEQRDALVRLGITLQQGFFHSEPKMLSSFVKL